jgi:hypothetical protein
MNASVNALAFGLQTTAQAAQSTTTGSAKRYLGLFQAVNTVSTPV